MRGPGGHSWADFGRPNPIQALATAIHTFSMAGPAKRSGSSFNFGIVRGGISVNAIPAQASMEVDLRSIVAGNLDALEHQLSRTVSAAHARRDSGYTRLSRNGLEHAATVAQQLAALQENPEAAFGIGCQPEHGARGKRAGIGVIEDAERQAVETY